MSEMLGNKYLMDKKHEKAVDEFRNSLRNGNGEFSTRCHLLLALMSSGNEEQALRECISILETEEVRTLEDIRKNCEVFLPVLNADVNQGLYHMVKGNMEKTLEIFSIREDELSIKIFNHLKTMQIKGE
ncbi:MAG: hypothetical protein JXR95_11340 [Deltaproteobacteria bacterium]|nr:hypothetical protein [Deltaproteobacteria bacterium]